MDSIFDPDILRKLRADKCQNFLIVNAPEGYLNLFSDFQVDTTDHSADKGKYDFVQVFGASQAELEHHMLAVKDSGKTDALFWACYPKGGGKIKSDSKRETVWAALELIQLRPVSQIALDETWSAMRGRPHALVKSK
jgi:hypothetical protein